MPTDKPDKKVTEDELRRNFDKHVESMRKVMQEYEAFTERLSGESERFQYVAEGQFSYQVHTSS